MLLLEDIQWHDGKCINNRSIIKGQYMCTYVCMYSYLWFTIGYYLLLVLKVWVSKWILIVRGKVRRHAYRGDLHEDRNKNHVNVFKAVEGRFREYSK